MVGGKQIVRLLPFWWDGSETKEDNWQRLVKGAISLILLLFLSNWRLVKNCDGTHWFLGRCSTVHAFISFLMHSNLSGWNMKIHIFTWSRTHISTQIWRKCKLDLKWRCCDFNSDGWLSRWTSVRDDSIKVQIYTKRERETAIWSHFYLSSCISAGEPDKSYFSRSWVNLDFSRSSIFLNNFIRGEAWLWHLLWWSAGLPGRTSGHLLLLMLLEFPSRKV